GLAAAEDSAAVYVPGGQVGQHRDICHELRYPLSAAGPGWVSTDEGAVASHKDWTKGDGVRCLQSGTTASTQRSPLRNSTTTTSMRSPAAIAAPAAGAGNDRPPSAGAVAAVAAVAAAVAAVAAGNGRWCGSQHERRSRARPPASSRSLRSDERLAHDVRQPRP